MTDPDDILSDELRAAAGLADGVPAAVVAAARASFTWRTIDAELATLAYDSADDLVGSVRGSGPRLLTFGGGDGVSVDVELDGSTLLGYMQPVGGLAVCRSSGSAPVDVDPHGRFSVDGVDRGPLSFRCTFDDGRVVHTEWVTV